MLVLVPGLVCDDAVWSHQRRTLESDRPVHVAQHGQLDTLTAMAAHVLAWAPPRFAIAGHSMGGRVALEIWRQASVIAYDNAFTLGCFAILLCVPAALIVRMPKRRTVGAPASQSH